MFLKSFAAGCVWLAIGIQTVAPQETAPERHEAYPGQASHARPPTGWYCSVTAKDEHHCECSREADATPYGGDLVMCRAEAEPDPPSCASYCFAHSTVIGRDKFGREIRDSSHCLCPVKCTMPGHHHS